MSVELDGQIALSLGWTELRPTHFSEVHDLMGKAPNGRIMLVPRWSSDLNAMWELEDTLTTREMHQYVGCLLDIVTPNHKEWSHWCGYYIHATADQRALAYLAAMEEKS